ncbi:molybdenum cofactor biosynthesis protein A [Glaciecola sp. KUL10]|nr:molybdenum cofactor biosynthesis protein A [Glaciecola sp. KUL10]
MGTKKVRITGGEPALRKDLLDIIKLVASVEKIQQVAITTNGYNLDRQVEKWADAGLTNLNVSIDSLDATQFKLITGDGRLQNILTGIEKAIDLGLNVKVNAVLLKSFTQKQLNQFLYWIKDKSISMRFIELMQTGDNLSFF